MSVLKNLFVDATNATPFYTPQIGPDLSNSDYNYFNDVPDEDQADQQDVGLIEDVATGFAAGIEGFGRSLVGLADMVMFDALPDEWSQRKMERPQGTVGSLVEGFTQFGLGLLPGLGIASGAGKAATALKLGEKAVKTVKGATAGISADFIAFSGKEEKLSDLLSESPFRNIVTDYLQTDQDDSEFEGRMKNVAEGAIIGGAITGIAKVFKAMRKYDGSDLAKEEVRQKVEALENYYVEQGTFTAKGVADAREVIDNVNTLTVDDLDVTFDDVIEPEAPAVKPEVKPEEPTVTFEGESAEAKVKEEAVPVEPQDDRLFIGDQSINSSERLVQALGTAIDIDDMRGVLNRMSNELKERQLNLDPKESMRHVIAQAKAMGQDESGYLHMIKAGVLEDPATRDAINLLRFKQQGAFLGVKISLDRIASISQNITELVEKGKQGTDEFMEAEMKLAEAEIQHQHFSIIHGEIGTGLARGLSERRDGAIRNFLELLEPTVKREDIVPNTSYLRDQANNNKTKIDDKETTDLLDKEGNIAKPVEDQEKAVKTKEKRLAELKEQLQQRREKFLQEGEFLPDDVKAKRKLEEDPEILQIQEQLKYYDGAIRQEKQLIKLRKELDEFANATDDELIEKEVAAARLKDAKKTNQQTPEYKKVKQRLATAKRRRLRNIKSPGVGPVQKEITKLTKQLEEARRRVPSDKKGRAKKASVESNPEVIKLRETLEYYQKALKVEQDIEKFELELKQFESATDQDLINRRAAKERLKEALAKGEEPPMVVQARRNLQKAINQRLSDIDSRGGNIRTRKNFEQYMQQRIGSKDVVTYAKRIAFAAQDGNLENLFDTIRKTSEASNFDKFSNAGLQMFQSSILSGPPSFTLNASAPLAVRALKRLEIAMGSAYGAFIKGDPVQQAIFKTAFGFHGTMMAGLDGFRMFSKGAKRLTDPVTGGRRPYDDLRETGEGALSPSYLGIDENSLLGKMFHYANKLVQLPFQINAGFDAINKTGAAYESLAREYYVEAVQRGIPEEKIAEYVKEQVQASFMKDGSLYSESNVIREIGIQARQEGYDPNDDLGIAKRYAQLMREKKIEFNAKKQEIADRAANYAKEVTFTSEAQGTVTKVLNFLRNKFPPLGLVIPFVNTPMQVLAFGFKRTLPGVAYDRLAPKLLGQAAERRKMYDAMSLTEQAAYRGQVATGVAGSSALIYFAYLNRDKLTGNGPRNPDELKALKATGWQPNSFIINADTDNPTYVSYGRLDPFATIISIAADMADAFDGRYVKDEEMMEVFSSFAFGMVENMTDKSFLRGLNNALNAVSDPETYGTKLFKDIGAASVPMFVDKLKDIGKENVLIRESRDLTDAILRKLPVAEEYVPPKRTFLGEAVYKQNPIGLLGVFNPIYTSSKKNDLVDKNIQELVHGFSMPSPRFNEHPDTDMRDFYNAEGRQAYDRFLELTGTTTINDKTLREALQGLFKSRGYKQLQQNIEQAGGSIALASQDPRIDQINRLISMYRRKAKRETYSEFPDLVRRVRELNYQRLQNNTTTVENPIPRF